MDKCFGIAGYNAITLNNFTGTGSIRMIKISFDKTGIQTFFKPLTNLTAGKIFTFLNNCIIPVYSAVFTGAVFTPGFAESVFFALIVVGF